MASAEDYIDYRDQTSQVFEGITAHFPFIPANLGGAGEPERIWGQVAAGNYFSVVGVKPSVGRAFTPCLSDLQLIPDEPPSWQPVCPASRINSYNST